VAALDRLASGTRVSPIDLAIQPSLLDQLSRMADGTNAPTAAPWKEGADGAARAAAILAELRHVVSSALIHVSAMPFSAPTIPSLIASGLSTDLATQQAAGRELVQSVLDVEPGSAVVRPPEGP
jgi:hypothetical protein